MKVLNFRSIQGFKWVLMLKRSTRRTLSKFRAFLAKFFGSTTASCAKVMQRVLTPKVVARLELILAVMPGLFFVSLGWSILMAPELIPLLLAAFCVSFGIFSCVLGLKLLAIKRKFSLFSHQIEARLILDPRKVSSLHQLEVIETSKKMVLH